MLQFILHLKRVPGCLDGPEIRDCVRATKKFATFIPHPTERTSS